ncbi:endo alpha-1,4 polygalactosaminidase [Bacteroidota bacterium]
MKYKLVLLSVLLLLLSCSEEEDTPDYNLDFKQEMRDFVIGISQYAKAENANFVVIPQNGQELVTLNGEEEGSPATAYLTAVDGVGREDLFYGYDDDNIATPSSEKNYMIAFLDICENNSVEVLTTDYCWTESKMDDSYAQNALKGYVSFAAPDRELNVIPDYPLQPININSSNITSLAETKNFLYLLNPEAFATKQAFINALSATNYDVIIIDCFFNDDLLTFNDVAQLKIKQNGGSRLVISYMSIGEAEDYRYYWQVAWNTSKPEWIEAENPDWEGNYKVKYWEQEWQSIIYGNSNAYLDKILDSGFDGIYLDIIDAFEYFE